ncbi:hypothetical protein FH972_026705 [Carpinus fangiana]|uniref:Flavin-containing monooxygenase n=1 Tax=Carpinus fangiana TaxID=176857 RepID=A0A5N6L520_9ROSI|nr:hypothetical protein FH972_026705 [Carpinus fangiana]
MLAAPEASNGFPRSSLFEVRASAASGRGVFALQDIPRNTTLFETSLTASHVIYNDYIKEVCAQCFAYDRGRTLKVRDSAKGLAFCSNACSEEWKREAAPDAESAREEIQKLLLKKKSVVSADVVLGNDRRPTGEEVNALWHASEEAAELIRACRMSSIPSKAMRRAWQTARSSHCADPSIVWYMFEGCMQAARSPEAWANVELLANDEQPYTYGDLTNHIQAYTFLLTAIPGGIASNFTQTFVRSLHSHSVHNIFGIRSLDEGGEEGDAGSECFGYGLWPLASYWNHSCAPNMKKQRAGKTWTFSASRDIVVGEELCITYLGGDEKHLPSEDRKKLLKHSWGSGDPAFLAPAQWRTSHWGYRTTKLACCPHAPPTPTMSVAEALPQLPKHASLPATMTIESKPWPQVPVGNKDHTSAAVVIVGAGISGMCMAIDLIKRNQCQNFIIVEKSGGVGGTWHDNKYPGCCCDVWSLLYSFSFEQKADWTRLYPGQEEILDYLITTAQRYNLYKYIRFNTTVEEARWDDVTAQWKTSVTVSGGKDAEYGSQYTITSDFLVSAVGQLNMPQWPSIPGLDSFAGKTMHSARWDWGYDTVGKKIAIVGSGATAVQIIPELAKTAANLTVFQRTANWIVPRQDEDVSAIKRTVLSYAPLVRQRMRAAMMDFRESFFDAIRAPDTEYSALLKSLCLEQMEAALPGAAYADMRKHLTPSYATGCKRICISDDFYPALAMPNVHLETRPIARATETGIAVTATHGGENLQDFDLIVCATGFRTVEFMHPIKITGRHGTPLADVWSRGAVAYKGVAVPELPNFGMLYGPNTNLGHNSIILMIETQSRYISALVGAVLERRAPGKGVRGHGVASSGVGLALVPKQAVVDAYNAQLQQDLATSSFADPACNSWYKDPRSGLITNNWSGTVIDYQKALEKVCWDDYEGGELVQGGREKYIGRVREESYVSDRSLGIFGAVGVAAVAAGVGWRYAAPMLRRR